MQLFFKKILTIILCLFLCSCSLNFKKNDKNEKYLNLMETLTLHDESLFVHSSKVFDISFECSNTPSGYRYYVVVDNPRYAMYGVSVLAIVVDNDYSEEMAANAGIFEDVAYNLVPGQTLLENGYVKGISVSGIVKSETPPILKVVVQYHSYKQEVKQEYFIYDFSEDGE